VKTRAAEGRSLRRPHGLAHSPLAVLRELCVELLVRGREGLPRAEEEHDTAGVAQPSPDEGHHGMALAVGQLGQVGPLRGGGPPLRDDARHPERVGGGGGGVGLDEVDGDAPGNDRGVVVHRLRLSEREKGPQELVPPGPALAHVQAVGLARDGHHDLETGDGGDAGRGTTPP